VDSTLAPVSRSHPSAGAQKALDACQVTNFYGLDSVARMALIQHASDARTYERFTGLEPELKTDDPAWLVEFSGGIYMPIEAETWYGTVCVVISGSAGFYGTGETMHLGKLYPAPSVPVEPTLALPTMAP
jgi:hypothetical protein